jgi:hypothetical protein
MSSPIWTPDALSSEARPFAGEGWRLVEAQHASSTMKLTDTLEEQAVLERLIDETKPAMPAACSGLHFLLASPFRYRPYPQGSRFRRAGMTPGVFYCASDPRTAVAEMAFYRVLFFAESPTTPWPANASEYTGFAVALRTGAALDLQAPPLNADSAAWNNLNDYAACQTLGEAVRQAGLAIIKYRSMRDPGGGENLAVLTCAAFAKPNPARIESWRIHLGSGGARAVREFPATSLEFGPTAFAADPRLAGMNWVR